MERREKTLRWQSRQARGAPMRDVHVSLDGEEIVTGSNDKFALIVDSAGGGAKIQLAHERAVRLTRFPSAEDQQRSIITLSGDKTLQLWDLRTAQVVHKWDTEDSGAIQGFAFVDEDANFLVSTADKSLRLFAWKNPKPVCETRHPKFIEFSSLCHVNKGNLVGLSSEGDCLIAIQARLDLGIQFKSKEFATVKGLTGGVTASHDKKMITVGDKRGCVQFWEEKTGKLMGKLEVAKKAVLGAIWHPKERSTIAAFGLDNQITKWK